MAIFEAAGFACTRAAGSLGTWDIIGIGKDGFIVCQVKTRDWPGTEEMEGLHLFMCPPNCKKIVHRWRDHQRMPDVKIL